MLQRTCTKRILMNQNGNKKMKVCHWSETLTLSMDSNANDFKYFLFRFQNGAALPKWEWFLPFWDWGIEKTAVNTLPKVFLKLWIYFFFRNWIGKSSSAAMCRAGSKAWDPQPLAKLQAPYHRWNLHDRRRILWQAWNCGQVRRTGKRELQFPYLWYLDRLVNR